MDRAREERPDQAVSPQQPALSGPASLMIGAIPVAARVLALQRSAGNRATARLLARATPASAGNASWSASDRAREILYQLHGGFGLRPDVEAALAQLRGQRPEVLREIRAAYARRAGGYKLERDFSELGTAAQRREALTLLGPVLPLADHLRLSVDPGLLYSSVDQDTMVDTLRMRMRRATLEERSQAASDRAVESLLRYSLDASHLYEAMVILHGGATEAIVEERIRAADSWWDDPQAVYNVLLDLPPERRLGFWERHRDSGLFDFLSSGERRAVEELCTTSDEAVVISDRMRLATVGPGTSESGVENVAERVRRLSEEFDAVERRLASGLSDDPEADSARRNELWGTLHALRWNATVDIVEMARGDLGAAEAAAFAADVGENPYSQLKQRLIDATRGTPEQVFAILEEASAHPGWLVLLQDDPDVSLALTTTLSMRDQNLAKTLRHGDALGAARLRLRRALSAVNTDEGAIVAVLLELKPADLTRLQAEDKQLCDELLSLESFDRDVGGIVRVIFDARPGEPPVDEVIDWALGGNWDGTKAQAVESALKLMDDTRVARYRLGYATDRGAGLPAGFTVAEASKARSEFAALDIRLRAEMGWGDYQRMLDVLLATPTPEELDTQRGVALAGAVVRLRALELASPREAAFTEAPSDWTSTRLIDLVSSTGPLADAALIRLEQEYARATADETLSGDELAVLAALGQEYTAAHAAAVKDTDWWTWAASATAAAGIGMVVSAATGGLATPWVLAAFGQTGVLAASALAGATAAGAAKVGTSELVGGSAYDATDEEGMRDFVGAFVDQGVTVFAGALIRKFPDVFSPPYAGPVSPLSAAPLSERLAAATISAGETSLSASGRSIGLAAWRGGLESFFAGVVSEFAMKSVDERAWRQSVWDVVVTFGQAMLKSGAQGVGTGTLFGGLGEAALVGWRASGAFAEVDDVVAIGQGHVDVAGLGLPRESIEKLPLEAVRRIPEVEAALAAGDVNGAGAVMTKIHTIKGADHAILDDVWDRLYSRARKPSPEVAAISPAGEAALLTRPPSNAQLMEWLPSGWTEAGLAALRPAQLEALQRLHARLGPLAGDPSVARGIERILPAKPGPNSHSPAGWARMLDAVPSDRLESVLRELGDPALPDPTLITGSAAVRNPVLRPGPAQASSAALLRWLPSGWSEAGLAALSPAQLAALRRLDARLGLLAADPEVARGIQRILPATPGAGAHSPAGWARMLDGVPDDRLQGVLRLLGDPALPDPTLLTGSAAIRDPVLRAGPNELAFVQDFGVDVWVELAGDRRWRDSLLPELVRETRALKAEDAAQRVAEALETVRAAQPR